MGNIGVYSSKLLAQPVLLTMQR